MMYAPADYSPDAAAGAGPATLSAIQTDAPCEHCRFNLNTQRVWRDGRLGILVTRCPECGAHQSAGRSVAVRSRWLTAIGSAVQLATIIASLALAVFLALLTAGVVSVGVRLSVDTSFQTIDGRAVVRAYLPDTTQSVWQVVTDTTHTALPDAAVTRHFEWESLGEAIGWRTGWPPGFETTVQRDMFLMICVALAMSILAGMAIAVLTRGWRRRWLRWVWMAVPVVGGVMSIAGRHVDDLVRSDIAVPPGVQTLNDSLPLIAWGAVVVLQMACVAVGMLAGRPAMRLAFRLFLPPGTRQVVANF